MSTNGRRTPEDQASFVGESLKEADALRKKREYKEAIALLVEALQYGLETATIYFQLGNIYVDGGDLARAEYAYKRALEINPSYVNAMHNLAVVYRRQKRMSLYLKTYKMSHRLLIEAPRETEYNPRFHKRVRYSSRAIVLWLVGGAALIVIGVRLLTR